MCLFEISLLTLPMLVGSIYLFFCCHLLWRTSCHMQHSPPWMSYQDFFFFFLTEITLQPKLVRTSLYAWVWKLQNLVWHNFIIYHFPFVTFTSLKKKKIQASGFNTHTNTKQHTFILTGCSYVSEHTFRGTKYRNKCCNIPGVLHSTPNSFTDEANSGRQDPLMSCWRMRS